MPAQALKQKACFSCSGSGRRARRPTGLPRQERQPSRPGRARIVWKSLHHAIRGLDKFGQSPEPLKRSLTGSKFIKDFDSQCGGSRCQLSPRGRVAAQLALRAGRILRYQPVELRGAGQIGRIAPPLPPSECPASVRQVHDRGQRAGANDGGQAAGAPTVAAQRIARQRLFVIRDRQGVVFRGKRLRVGRFGPLSSVASAGRRRFGCA